MPQVIGYNYLNTQGSIYPMRISRCTGIFPPMETTFRAALEHAATTTGKSIRSIAESAGISYDKLKNLSQGKSKTTNVDDAMRVAASFGVSLEDFYEGLLHPASDTVAVAGKVGAGAEIDLYDDHAKGNGLYHVARPAQLQGKSVVAVEVKGDSMEPIYAEGDVLFYSRATHEGVPVEAIGKKCIAEDMHGRVWVKYLKAGDVEGTYSLISLNPTGANMHGTAIRWAAPVRLHLPADQVKKIL
jgi:phage repressor protein C with HTH and peptisase S24 domain